MFRCVSPFCEEPASPAPLGPTSHLPISDGRMPGSSLQVTSNRVGLRPILLLGEPAPCATVTLTPTNRTVSSPRVPTGSSSGGTTP